MRFLVGGSRSTHLVVSEAGLESAVLHDHGSVNVAADAVLFVFGERDQLFNSVENTPAEKAFSFKPSSDSRRCLCAGDDRSATRVGGEGEPRNSRWQRA